MENVICVDGTMSNRGNNSSPVPFVGLYIAAATLVCFILICCDIWAGFSRKKLWFPVRFFSLNSVSLTLLSISTKIPVDLTSEMPSVQDQLSKLSGTVFICMVMGFMLPSVGINREFEAYSNIAALTIFVITVIVNICIQMKTGVIFCFFVEHSIIMFCMVLLVFRFLMTAGTIDAFKMETAHKKEDLIERHGETSMLERLKSCYMRAYTSCPQFLLSRKNAETCYVSIVCTVCFLVLAEAILRSSVFKDLKFRGGVSDYKWSMWLILVTQITTVAITGLVIGFRLITFAAHFNTDMEKELEQLEMSGPKMYDVPRYLYLQSVFVSLNFPKSMENILRHTVYHPLAITDLILGFLALFPVAVTHLIGKRWCRYKTSEEEEWVLSKWVDDRERCMEHGKKSVTKHVMEMLSTIPSTQVSLLLTESTKLSSLSLLVLVHLATITTPTSQSASLTYVLHETFDAIHFIDSQVNIQSINLKHRCMYANVLWKFGFDCMSVNYETRNKLKNYMLELESHLESDHFVGIIEIFERLYFAPLLRSEASHVGRLLNSRSYASTNEWFNHIRQVFVNMLHGILSQLPIAIYDYIAQSPMEEYEDRVRYCLHLVCKLQALESYVAMSFPEGTSIVRLIDTGTEGVTENSQLETIVHA